MDRFRWITGWLDEVVGPGQKLTAAVIITVRPSRVFLASYSHKYLVPTLSLRWGRTTLAVKPMAATPYCAADRMGPLPLIPGGLPLAITNGA
jgi:hypothetical protein